MSVEIETGSSGPYTANGTDQAFNVTFYMASASEIAVYANGVLLSSSLYEVTRLGTGTGTVRPVPPLANGTAVLIETNPHFRQEDEFTKFGNFNPAQVTPPLDRAAARDIYLKDQIGKLNEGLADAVEALYSETIEEVAAATASATAEAILEALEGSTPSDVWIVSPAVAGSGGAGTVASPWSLEYAGAGAGGAILPGATVLLRGQRPGGAAVADYKPYTTAGKARSVGFEITVSGTDGLPITWKNFPGEVATFADPIPIATGWTKVTTKEDGITPIDASANVYETVDAVAAGTTNAVTAYYAQGGDFLMLGCLRGATGAGPYVTTVDIEAMYATSSRFRNTKIYYPGPCVVRLGSGKLRIRLDPCYTEAHETGTANPFFGETTQVYPTSTNPAFLDLRVYIENDVGLVITGDFNTIDGGVREAPGFVFHGFERGGLCDRGNNNNVNGCRFYAPYIGLNIGAVTATSAGVYHDNILDGMLDFRKSPFSRGDVKNGGEVLTRNRSQAFAVGNIASGGHSYRNTIRRSYDGTVFNAANWEIGFTPDPALGLPLTEREAVMWEYGNTFEQIWDDGMQVYSGAQNADIHHNKFLGAGISRDGAGSGSAKGPNKVKVHHNIFDGLNYQVVWDRAGRDYTVIADSGTRTTVNGAFTSGATTVTVASGAVFGGLALPANLTICKASAPWSIEQVQLTAVVGNDLTLVRARTPIGAVVPDTAFALATGDVITTSIRDVRSSEEGRCTANVLPTHGLPADATSDTIAAAEWTAPVSTATTSALVYLYQRSDTVPTLPSGTITYTFATGLVTGLTNGWSQAMSAIDGRPQYRIVAAVSGSGATATIASTQWQTPRFIAAGGLNGEVGGATEVRVYVRAASTPALPSLTATHTIATGAVANLNNSWTVAIPAPDGNPLWIAVAPSNPTRPYRFPWDFYHNTVLAGPNISGQPNLYFPFMMAGTEASNTEAGAPKNLAFNNLLIAAGSRFKINSSLTNRTGYLNPTRLYTGRGENIHDGNVYVSTDSLPLLLIQLLRDSLGANYDNSIDTIAEFRAGQLLTDAVNAAGYAPGMESKGLAYLATTASQIDASYRPLDARTLVDAIELTPFALPGMEFYQPWRGAVGPL